MVFTNLGTNEKDAFFSLLDEYFASRPEIFNATTQGGSSASNPFRKEVTGPQAHAAAAAVGRAGDAASKFVSAGLRGVRSSSPSGGRTTPGSTTASQHGNSESGDTQSGGTLADRIAQLHGSKKNDTGGSSGGSSTADRGGGVSNLSSARKFGDVDTSSTKNLFGSIRNSSSNPPKSFQPPQHNNAVDSIPSAFPSKHNASRFGPPPGRAAAPPRQPEPEPEEQGEWAEALYDFETAEPGDLELQEGQRILVIERTSDDWWTGELNGKKGLFPALYVKLV